MAGSSSPSIQPPHSKKKFGLVKKVLLGLTAFVVLILVLTPLIVPAIAKPRIAEALEGGVDGVAEIGDLSFSWPGEVVLKDLTMRDRRGELLFTVARIAIDAGPFALMFGSIEADVVVEKPEIRLRERADGTFAPAPPKKDDAPAAKLVADRKPEGAKGTDRPTAQKTAAKPVEPPAPKAAPVKAPKLKLDLRVSDGVAVVELIDGTEARFTDLKLDVRVDDGLDKSARIMFSVRSGAGSVSLAGDLVLAPGGYLDPEAITGSVSYVVDRLDLRGLEPLVVKYAPLDRFEGVVDGGGEYRVSRGPSVAGKGALAVEGLAVSGAALGTRPIAVKRLVVNDEISIDASGSGNFRARLTADEFLSADVRANVATTAAGGRRTDGSAALAADFGGLSRAAPGLLKLKDGYRLDGKATIESTFDVAEGSSGLSSLAAKFGAKLADLAAFDGEGRPIPIDREARLDAEVAQKAGGAAELKNLDLRVGLIAAEARGSFDAESKKVGPSFLNADVDLDDLSKKLASFMDLGFDFGGKIAVTARVEGGSETALATSMTRVTALRLANFGGRDFGPLDLVFEQAGTIDMRPGGRTTIEKADLTSSAVKFTTRGFVTDVADPAKVSGELTCAFEGDPAALQRVAGDFFAGYVLGGSTLKLDLTSAFSPAGARAAGKFRTNGLFVGGPTFGPDGVRIGTVSADFDGTIDTESKDLDLRSLVVKASELSASLKDAPAPVRLRRFDLEAAATMKGTDAEVKSFRFSSDLANAEGSVRAKGIGKTGMSAEGSLSASGDVKPLVELAQAFLPEYRDARATGTWRFEAQATTKGDDVALTADFSAARVVVSGVQAGGRDLGTADADVSLTADLALNTSGVGAADLKSIRLTAPGASATLKGKASKFLGEGSAPEAALTIEGGIDPGEMSRRLGAFLRGYEIGGRPIAFDVAIDRRGLATKADARVRTPAFVLTMPADPAAPPESPAARPRTLRQEDMALAVDLTHDATPGAESLDIRTATYASKTARAEAKGRLAGVGYASADLTVTADAELADVVRDFGTFMTTQELELRGKSTFAAKIKGSGDRAKLDGALKTKDFVLSTPDEAGGPPNSVREPNVDLVFDVDSLPDSGTIVLNVMDVKSGFLWGGATGKIMNAATAPEFVGLRGEFSYHPDRLGAVLKPFMTAGRLEGAEVKKVRLSLDGKATETDWVSVLRGSTGTVDAAVARLIFPAVDVLGDLEVAIKDERVETRGLMKMNGGDLVFTSELDLRRRTDAVSKFGVKLSGAKANGEMAPLLALVNPIFALDAGGAGGALAGLLNVELNMTYTGRVDPNTFTGGAASFPYAGLDGKGRVGFVDLVVQGSSLIGVLSSGLFGGGLGALAGGGSPFGGGANRIDSDPVEFTIRRGRLYYDKPISMSISGTRLEWNGSVGLDKSLDLSLDIPVTDSMTRKHGFLSFFAGEKIRIPLSGAADKPELRLDEALGGLAQAALKKQAEKGIGEALGGALGGLFGGGKPNPPTPTPSPTDPPPAPTPPPSADSPFGGLGGIFGGIRGARDSRKAAELLKQADDLYDQGKKKDAAPIYKEIRSRYAATDSYKNHKERIEKRELEGG